MQYLVMLITWLKNVFAAKPEPVLPAPAAEPSPVVITQVMPSYIKSALSTVGKKEGKDDKWIVHLFNFTTYKTSTSKTPWCAAFVSAILEQNGYKSARSASALDQRKLGTEADASEDFGVCVWQHLNGSLKGRYHTNFSVRKVSGSSRECVGGNQSNAVTIAKYGLPDYKLVYFRKPTKK